MDSLRRHTWPTNVVGLLRATIEDFTMNIEHKTTPIEHWIVDGKAYRMATENGVGKEVYRTDLKDGVLAATHPVCGTVTLAASEPGHEKPYVCVCRWKFAYIQDDSLLTPPTPPTSPIDWTKPVRTKDGRAVRVLCTDGPGDYPIVGFIDGIDEPQTWRINGTYLSNNTKNFDLENAPQRIQREYWVNVYDGVETLLWYDTKKEADENGGQRFACVKITIDCEEGEGL